MSTGKGAPAGKKINKKNIENIKPVGCPVSAFAREAGARINKALRLLLSDGEGYAHMKSSEATTRYKGQDAGGQDRGSGQGSGTPTSTA